ncbi:hypothetical protein ABEG18_17770 [Alsobacter sp. KACC 23698]|uniref:Uncharacterized protein n=1 Tax=Alsobacter sp. KACC 23698 TaxID=3149229 RepID=A0AAU7JB31_9HYPH
MINQKQQNESDAYASFADGEIRPAAMHRLLSTTVSIYVFNHSGNEVVRLV